MTFGAVTLGANSTITNSGTSGSSITFNSTIAGNGYGLTLNPVSGTTATLSGVLSGNGSNDQYSSGNISLGTGGITPASLIIGGAGTVVLTANNTYSGETQLNSGTLQIGSGSSAAAGTGAMNLDGGTLISGYSGNTLTVSNSLFVTANSTVGGANSINFNGTDNNFSAGDGYLNNYITFGNSTSTSATNFTFASNNPVSFAGYVIVANNAVLNLATNSVNNGNYQLAINAGSTVNVSNINAFGTVSNPAFSTSGTGASAGIVINGTLNFNLASGTLADTSTTVSLSTGGIIGATTSNSVISLPIGLAGGSFSPSSGRILTENGLISGSSTLTQAGAGELILGGSNTSFTGPTTVSAGTLSVQNINGLGSSTSATITINSGTILDLNYSSGILSNESPISLGGGEITFSDVTATPPTTNNSVGDTLYNLITLTAASTIGGAGLGTIGGNGHGGITSSLSASTTNLTIAMTGSTGGIVMEAANMSYSGNTSLNSGIAYIYNSNYTNGTDGSFGLLGSTNVIFNGGSVASMTGGGYSFAYPYTVNYNYQTNNVSAIGTATALPITGAGTLSSGAVLETTGSPTISGNLSGAGALYVNGGTTILSGTNSYTGATTVNSGTLSLQSASALGGNSSASVTVDSGSVLNTSFGTATTLSNSAPTIVLNGGTLSNVGAGAVTISNLISLQSSSTISEGAGAINFNTGSQISAQNSTNGTLTMSGSSSGIGFTLPGMNLSPSGGTWNLSVTTTNAGIAQSGSSPISVSGTSSFNAGTGAITLTNTSNVFTGAVTLTDTSSSNTNTVSLYDTAALSIASASVGSSVLTLTGTGISQAGAIIQSGTAGNVTLAGGTGTVILTNTGNKFIGTVGVTSSNTGATAINIADSTSLTLGTITDSSGGGVVASVTGTTNNLTVSGPITLGSTTNSSLSLTSGNNITVNSSLSGYNISLVATNTAVATNSIFLNGATISATNNLTLTALSNTGSTAAAGSITATSGTAGVASAISVGAEFDLTAGNWLQAVVDTPASLPNFAATNFVLGTTNTQFIRANVLSTGTQGSLRNPYQISDVYGLQGIGSSATTLGYSYQQVQNFSASGT